MTRRTLLTLLASVPASVRAAIQTPEAVPRRLVCDGNRGFLRDSDGTVLAWRHGGLGFRGVSLGLGHDDDVPPFAAFPVAGLRNVVDVAIGGSGGYALMPDGRLFAWGVNARGGVGNTPLSEFQANAAPRGSATSPTPVFGLTDVAGISANGDHALAVTRAGVAYAWGYNGDYQLGIGDWPVITFKTRSAQPTNFMPYPVPIPGLSDVSAVAAGGQHSLALMKDGTVRAWGFNRWGQLGDGTVTNRRTPVVVTGVKNAVAVAASVWVSAALLADGTVMTWGFGTGALGPTGAKLEAPNPVPALVPGVTGIRALALGETHALALINTGTGEWDIESPVPRPSRA
jgi:alpha-tubulin suppressor-like RCC1 family protein